MDRGCDSGRLRVYDGNMIRYKKEKERFFDAFGSDEERDVGDPRIDENTKSSI